MSDGGWLSVHAFHHADLDPLLVEAVRPLVARLAATGLADEFFFLRYWDGGTHLRLRVRPREPAAAAEVRARTTDALCEYLARRPSLTAITPEEYARTAAEHAAAEGMAAAEPLRPDNSVVLRDYHREHEKYGYGQSMDAVERHFVESSRLALEVVRRSDPLVRRATTACAAILVAWLHGGQGPARRAFTVRADEPVPADQVARVSALADRIRALPPPDATHAADSVLGAWTASIVRLRAAVEASAGPDPAFVTDMCAHLFCNRIGVDVGTERFLRRVALAALSPS